VFKIFDYDFLLDNSKELVADLLAKAKQIETLINSLPIPEQEEEQVSPQFFRPTLVIPLS
jgi:hypothetical protein